MQAFGTAYYQAGYVERYVLMLESSLVDSGILTALELADRVQQLAASPTAGRPWTRPAAASTSPASVLHVLQGGAFGA